MTARTAIVRDGSKLTYEELCNQANRLLSDSEYTQEEMADRLGVARISVAKAVTQPGAKFQRLQMRIIEDLSDYEVEREETVRFRTWKKERGD